MASFLGIKINDKLEFIIRNSLKIQNEIIPSKKIYEKKVAIAIAKGKKGIDTYNNMFNSSLLLITLGFLLISIQASVPSIKTSKVHPGCKQGKLFKDDGYIFNMEDKTSILYIACVANKIKSSVEPWDSIQKMGEKSIAKKMEAIMTKYILHWMK